jgi:2-octaprenylphenol hydroxylase
MDYDIVIVGAGLVGASFALSLRGCGLKLALVEAQAPAVATGEWDSRIYAISPGSAAFLDTLGIWKRLEQSRIQPVQEMLVAGDAAGASLRFSAYESGVAELAWIVESRHLQALLWQGLEQQQNLDLICPDKGSALKLFEGGAELTLAGAGALKARLVVAADGMHSWTREAAGIEVKQKPYRQMGVVANFATEKAHHGTAFQWFRADGVLAYLPLPGNRVSIVWSTADAHAATLLALPADEFCARVCEAGAQTLGKLSLLTPPAQFPLGYQRAARLVAPGIALIGDAAHVLHPLAGQGVNLGFGDARELAKVLLERELFRDLADIRLLRRFERARAGDILALAFATDGLQRLFSLPGAPAAGLRNAGLNFTDALPVVKNLLVRQALG